VEGPGRALPAHLLQLLAALRPGLRCRRPARLARHLARDHRARHAPRHAALEPGGLLHRVRPLAGRTAVFLVVVGLMVVPVQVALLPVVQLYRSFGSLTGFNPYGTIEGVVIFHVAFGLPFGIFLMRNFYVGIPLDLVEAARIDGAGEGKLFRRLIIPLGMPAVASLLIFQFIWVWNDLLVALVFLGGYPHTPLTLFLVRADAGPR
jgi:ABC-type glycerol-3-phosphate transport system permease component